MKWYKRNEIKSKNLGISKKKSLRQNINLSLILELKESLNELRLYQIAFLAQFSPLPNKKKITKLLLAIYYPIFFLNIDYVMVGYIWWPNDE